MRRFITLSILALLILSQMSCSHGKNCQAILAKKINQNDQPEKVLEDLKELKGCGLDDYDVKLLINGPVIGTIMIKKADEHQENITYGDVLHVLDTLLKAPEYKKLKEDALKK